jgi:hypothetical protein
VCARRSARAPSRPAAIHCIRGFVTVAVEANAPLMKLAEQTWHKSKPTSRAARSLQRPRQAHRGSKRTTVHHRDSGGGRYAAGGGSMIVPV